MAHEFAPLKNDLILRTAWGTAPRVNPQVRMSNEHLYGSCAKLISYFLSGAAGRYLPEYHEAKDGRDFFECCRDPEVASTLTLQPIERFAGLIDAAIIFSDILVIPQAMGMVVEMVDKLGPHFPEPLRSPDDGQYERVLQKKVDVATELDYVYKSITMTRKKLQGRVPLIGFCGAPWTLLCYMTEGGGSKTHKESKTWIYKYPEAAKALLQKISEVCVEYLALQVQAGAQLIQRALPGLHCGAPPQAPPGDGIGEVPMIVFPKGANHAIDSVCNIGYNVIGLDWVIDPAEAVKIRGDRKIVFQGNADPGILYGSHENITETVEHMVKGFGGGKKGWIANLGHGVTPFVKPDDLKFYLSEVQRCSKR
ncbi:uroporphyrinogen decarboxylase [Apiospora phragmitis]|uniref:uroporphyrinogen decarboxylase n=1 Tax=Apiospora phragmitis TaxID=2905665 RepID=A0ABR1TVS4_9PEZI